MAIPDRPAPGCFDHGLRPDCRHVDAQILPALGRLDQHPALFPTAQAEPGLPHLPHPPHHPVGALGPLDRQDMAVSDDGALADIEGGEGCEKIETEADGVPVVGAGLPRTGQGAGRDEIGGKLMSADDPVPPLLEQHHRAAQHLIVARG